MIDIVEAVYAVQAAALAGAWLLADQIAREYLDPAYQDFYHPRKACRMCGFPAAGASGVLRYTGDYTTDGRRVMIRIPFCMQCRHAVRRNA